MSLLPGLPDGNVPVPAAADPARHRLSAAAKAAVQAGVPEATRRAYREALAEYVTWCSPRGLAPFPCTAAMITEYGHHLTSTPLSDGTNRAPVGIEHARWAIVRYHNLAGLTPPDTTAFAATLNGYRQRISLAHDPKAQPRKSATARKEILATLLAAIDQSTIRGQRDAAMILLGFGIGARSSEIGAINIEAVTVTEQGIQVNVYRRKTKKWDNPVVKFRQDPALCPARAVVRWSQALTQATGRTTGPLFVRIDQHGNFAPVIMRQGKPIGDPDGRLTARAARDIVRDVATRSGVNADLAARKAGQRLTWHGLRRGLATEMHEAGHGRRAIERQGGWTEDSRAVAGYIEDSDRWLNDFLEGVL